MISRCEFLERPPRQTWNVGEKMGGPGKGGKARALAIEMLCRMGGVGGNRGSATR